MGGRGGDGGDGGALGGAGGGGGCRGGLGDAGGSGGVAGGEAHGACIHSALTVCLATAPIVSARAEPLPPTLATSAYMHNHPSPWIEAPRTERSAAYTAGVMEADASSYVATIAMWPANELATVPVR